MTTSPVMTWLAAGLPITLLCDLMSGERLDSRRILEHEAADAETVDAETLRGIDLPRQCPPMRALAPHVVRA
jgi:hypothetical protein